MDGSSHQFLTRARLSGNQHRRSGWRDAGNLLIKLDHFRRTTDQASLFIGRGELLRFAVLCRAPLSLLECPASNRHNLFDFEGLRNKIPGAFSGSLDGRIKRAETVTKITGQRLRKSFSKSSPD